jgi:hypothetical protein
LAIGVCGSTEFFACAPYRVIPAARLNRIICVLRVLYGSFRLFERDIGGILSVWGKTFCCGRRLHGGGVRPSRTGRGEATTRAILRVRSARECEERPHGAFHPCSPPISRVARVDAERSSPEFCLFPADHALCDVNRRPPDAGDRFGPMLRRFRGTSASGRCESADRSGEGIGDLRLRWACSPCFTLKILICSPSPWSRSSSP